jgi:hypothetical protein
VSGKVVTTFHPADGSAPVTVDERPLTDQCNAAVFYHNPYDNVVPMAHHFFSRCLEAKVRLNADDLHLDCSSIFLCFYLSSDYLRI